MTRHGATAGRYLPFANIQFSHSLCRGLPVSLSDLSRAFQCVNLSYDAFNQSLTTLGPIARIVEDLITVPPIISGSDGIDPFAHDVPLGDPGTTNVAKLRFALYTDNGVAAPVPAIDEAVRQVALRIEAAGAAVEERRPAETEQALDLFWGIVGGDRGYGINRTLAESGTEEVALYMTWAQGNAERYETASLSHRQCAELFMKWHTVKSNMTRFFTSYDAILCPVSAIPAPTHDVDMKLL